MCVCGVCTCVCVVCVCVYVCVHVCVYVPVLDGETANTSVVYDSVISNTCTPQSL